MQNILSDNAKVVFILTVFSLTMPLLYACFLSCDTELMEKHILNTLAAKIAPDSEGESPKIHVELFFPDTGDLDDEVVTGKACSIHYNGKVFLTEKRFSRTQWQFRSMNLNDEQYEKIYAFCEGAVGSSFNHVGYFLQPVNKYLNITCNWPVNIGGYKPRYYCSEIVMEGLKAGGILDKTIRSSIHPQEVFTLLEDATTRSCARNLNSMSLDF
jgi:hypothetical protein